MAWRDQTLARARALNSGRVNVVSINHPSVREDAALRYRTVTLLFPCTNRIPAARFHDAGAAQDLSRSTGGAGYRIV